MNLVIKKSALLKMLNVAMDAIPSKSTEASFLNFLLTVTNEGCTLLACDGKMSIKVNLLNLDHQGNKVILESQPGSIQLPAKLCREIIANIAGDIITLEIVDTTVLTISDDKTTYNINTKPGREYPDIELGAHIGEEFSIKPEDFMELYESTYFAAAIKSARDIFLGINIKTQNNKISFTASDTARLARKTLPIETSKLLSFNCPLKVLSVISKIENLPTINVKVGADRVSFTVGNVVIGTKTIQGEYPDADKIIPSTYSYVLRCSAKELVEVIDRVCIFGTDDKNITKNAKLSFDGKKVEISSRNTSFGNSCEKLENCTFEGGEFTIYFNANFVRDACRAQKYDQVSIHFSGEVRMFRVSSKDEDNLQLITPVRYYPN